MPEEPEPPVALVPERWLHTGRGPQCKIPESPVCGFQQTVRDRAHQQTVVLRLYGKSGLDHVQNKTQSLQHLEKVPMCFFYLPLILFKPCSWPQLDPAVKRDQYHPSLHSDRPRRGGSNSRSNSGGRRRRRTGVFR